MLNTIGIRREDTERIGEQRSAIAPAQTRRIVEAGGQVLVQPAINPATHERKRAFGDHEYVDAGAHVREDLTEADIIFGLKEVEPPLLLPEKVYFFFSHTHKGQEKNRPLLEAMIAAKVTLVDYELVADTGGNRLLTTFTYFAGYAGIVDTLWTLGRRLEAEGIDSVFQNIEQAISRPDLAEVRNTLKEVGKLVDRFGTPAAIPPVVICVLGRGKTSAGVQELLDLLPVTEISIKDLDEVVSSGSRARIYKLVLEVDEMYRIRSQHSDQVSTFDALSQHERIEFYLKNPNYFESNLDNVLPHVTVLVNCIVWSSRYPRTVSSDLMAKVWDAGTPLKVIGDITCDPNGSIEFSRETWIDDPVFTYDPRADQHRMGVHRDGVTVMAVTNLPCEFSRDASIRFGQELERFLPQLLSARFDGSLEDAGLAPELGNATILWKGQLTMRYEYMREFLK
ncbi:MAG: hypothetical protein KJO98_14815 [Rhodothermia bacterium]|nr:hypothetical protein [Rhodothermia bacterium]